MTKKSRQKGEVPFPRVMNSQGLFVPDAASTKPSEGCIFCDKEANLTQEHILGQWLKEFVKSSNTKTIHITSRVGLDHVTGEPVPSIGKGRLSRVGPPHIHQLQIVCDDCNSGWMSEIQNSAKDIIPGLLDGKWPVLSVKQISHLVSYATMVTMVTEFADLHTLSISRKARHEFKKRGRPGRDWQVLLGLCQDIDQTGSFWHRAAGIFEPDSPPSRIPNKPNTQTTTFYMGRSFFHTISGPREYLWDDADGYAEFVGMKRIWPIPANLPAAPRVLSPDEVGWAAAAFWTGYGLSPLAHFGMIQNPAANR